MTPRKTSEKKSKVLVCVAELYNGTEFWGLIKVLKRNGVSFDVMSGQKVIQNEKTSEQLRLKMRYSDVGDPSKLGEMYDGIVCVSGAIKPTMAMWRNDVIAAAVRRASELGKPVAGICCSAPAVRTAMKGKKVSCYPLPSAQETCEAAGATVMKDQSLTVDGNVVTAEHEWVTEEWAEAFVKLLKR